MSRQPLLIVGQEATNRCYSTITSQPARSYIEQIISTRPKPSQSIVCAPFLVRNTTIGSIYLEHWSDQRTFTESDLRLLCNLADLIAIAIDNGRLWLEAQQKEKLNHQLMAKLISAQEDERKRLARELHDEISSALTAVIVTLSSLLNIVPPVLSDLQSRLASLQAVVKEVMAHLKDLIFAIRPMVLDNEGLAGALKWYALDYLGSAGPCVSLQIDEKQSRLDPELETAIFRVAQEALNNAIKYSRASQVLVRLYTADNRVHLVVEDNGVGFNVEEVMADAKRSLGLHGMVERIWAVNGTLQITSALDKGTVVQAEIPVEGTEEESGSYAGCE